MAANRFTLLLSQQWTISLTAFRNTMASAIRGYCAAFWKELLLMEVDKLSLCLRHKSPVIQVQENDLHQVSTLYLEHMINFIGYLETISRSLIKLTT